MSNQNNNWVPEIMYEDSQDGMTSKIPFIMVPETEIMPKILFMFESRETGEFEPAQALIDALEEQQLRDPDIRKAVADFLI